MRLASLLLLPCLTIAFAVPSNDVAERLTKWKTVPMAFHSDKLPARQKQMIEKLVEATRLLDDVFWRQSDKAGLELYKITKDANLKTLLNIMGSRWDLVDEHHSFAGAPAMPPGHELYPQGWTRPRIEDYVKQHPADKAGIYDPYTVVKLRNDRLTAVHYRDEYKEFLTPMAAALRDAAALSDDLAFAAFLRLRAEALLSDDYYKSDLAWIDLKVPKVDVIFAPYETYLDDLLGVKTSYGAAVLIRNDEESSRLQVYQKYVPEIQDALPLAPAARPSKHGHLTPMEVMDAPYRGGDLRHGYQAVADNLPNDPRIHQEKGTKKIFFKNFMDARVTNVVLPIARKIMVPEQASKASAEGYLAATLMHEISHELGPAFANVDGKQIDIREAIGPAYSGLEEAKADVTGMFGVQWLMDHGAMPKGRAEEYYASYVAGIFRTLRFGTGEAHGRAQMMEFNYLQEKGALMAQGSSYRIEFAKIPRALASLAKELLEMEATGDRARTEAWFRKYNVMPTSLKSALANTAEVPVDLYPVFSFQDNTR